MQVVQVRKGTTIGRFLEVVKQQISAEFNDMKMISAENLLYIKEDLIIPHVRKEGTIDLWWTIIAITVISLIFVCFLCFPLVDSSFFDCLSFLQHYTFYDLIITKARGKSGPLFHFDVHDDVRLISDATIEKDESHPGKVKTMQ